MKKTKFKWTEHEEMRYLMFMILDKLRTKHDPKTTEEMREMFRKCAVKLSAITDKEFTPNQVEGQCFITGDFMSLTKAKLRNLSIAIESGYMTPERFETDIHEARARKMARQAAKEVKVIKEEEKVLPFPEAVKL